MMARNQCRPAGNCIHCKGEIWYNEDEEKYIFNPVDGCLCEIEDPEEQSLVEIDRTVERINEGRRVA